ncbi:MAG: M36 family metallopeptidase [Blastocatellia bacterium]
MASIPSGNEPVIAQGIRRYPYGTDKTVNPLTFASIALNPEVRLYGEIWCVALWEMRAALIKQASMKAAPSIQLVLDGPKRRPRIQRFWTRARCVLLANRVNNNGAISACCGMRC